MRYRVATAFFARPTVFTRIKHPQNPYNVSLSSASKQKEEFEEIAKSVYREILRACAGKRRVKLSSTSKAKTEEEQEQEQEDEESRRLKRSAGAIPFRVRALLANNLRGAFRTARDGEVNVTESEKIANLARTISIWTFCHRANEDDKSTEYILLNNLVSYYDSRAKLHSRSKSKKVIRDQKTLASLETEFNTLCVKPLIEHIERSASLSSSSSSSSSSLRPPFVFDI
tara:strand:+ start:198 stop:881 length:684 start_codon:yes stop_codon:yes gene_type:complete